jgi:hypothetical protein
LYGDSFERAEKNFAAYPRAKLVKGLVPQTLDTVAID